MRTRTTLTYRAKHGSFETHAYAESVNYRDETGAWRRVDNALRRRGGAVTNGANRYRMTVPDSLESGEIRVAVGSTWVEFEPRDVRPAPVETAGSQARFRDAWPGVRLAYTATGDTVKEALVVQGPAHVRDFVFDVRLAQGLTPKQVESGAILLQDQAGNTAMTIAPSYMVDAAGAYAPTPTELHRELDGWSLRIKPDRIWVNAAERQWPVTIDPTVVVGTALSCQIVRSGAGASSGSCGSPPVWVGESYECDAGTQFPPYYCEAMRALVRFDVTAALPPGAVVEHAEIATNAPPTPLDLAMYEVTTSWTDDVDWNTRDGVTPWTSACCGVAGGAQHDRVRRFPEDITEVVRAWATRQRPNHGLLFAARYNLASSSPITVSPVLTIQHAETDDPEGAVQAHAIESYMLDEGISREEALRRLRIQDRIGNIAAQLEAAISPQDYAGWWVDDDDNGRIKVAIKSSTSPPPSTKTAAARSLLAEHALEDEVDFVSVAHSLVELEDAEEGLGTAVEELIVAGKVTTGIRLRTNRVTVRRANSLTPAEDAQLQAALGNVPTAYVVTPVGRASLAIEPINCDKPDGFDFLGCDPPWRAGGILYPPTGRCTGGPLATSETNGLLYMITAGHCIQPGALFRTRRANGDFLPVGTGHRAADGPYDVGSVHIPLADSEYYDTSPPGFIFVTENRFSNTTHNERYPIRRVRRTGEVRRLCVTTAVEGIGGRHSFCGRVEDQGERRTVRGYKAVRHLAILDICGIPVGGSGGPVYKSRTLFGTMVATDGCDLYYQGALDAENQLNLDIVTSP